MAFHRMGALAFVLFLLPVTAATPDPTPTPETASPGNHAPAPDRFAGWPGEYVQIDFPDPPSEQKKFYYDGCWVALGDPKAGNRQNCKNFDAKSAPTIRLAIPAGTPAGPTTIAWGYWQTIRDREMTTESGTFDFVIKETKFEATRSASAGVPGDRVTVRFRSLIKGVRITGCQVQLLESVGDCPMRGEPAATVTVPGPGKDPALMWIIRYVAGNAPELETPPDFSRFRIDPLPPPKFTVEANRKTAGPGESVTVRFASATEGVTLQSCTVKLVEPVPCDPKTFTAEVPLPANQPQGDTTLTWDLTYVSTRPGETKGGDHGELPVEVVVQPRQFVVTIQPGEAAPGEPVTLTFTSATAGVDIVGCLAAFAHATGDECRRSSKRWFARTRVPLDAAPGTAVLRWGIAARNAAGADLADNGALDYTVLPPRNGKPTESQPATESPSPTVGATSSQGGDATNTQPLSAADFYATTDPESARPGDRVVVDVSPAGPGVEISGCRVAFSGHSRTRCRPAAGGWSATVTVPSKARPGTVPLRWDATAAGTGGAGGGTIDYEVLGADPPAAAFSVLPEPASTTAGTKIKLSYVSLVDGVDIAGCSAGFTPDSTSACRRTADGWVADLAIPDSMPVGRTQVHWQLTYQRVGGTGTGATDGLTLFEVLPHRPGPGWLRQLLIRVAIGALALLLPLAFTPVRRRLGRLFRRGDGEKSGDTDDTSEELTAVAVDWPENTRVTVEDREVPAMSLIGVIPHLDPILHEEEQ